MERRCKKCNKPISLKSESGLCQSCFNKSRKERSTKRCRICGVKILEHNKSGLCKKCFPKRNSKYAKEKRKSTKKKTEPSNLKRRCWHCGKPVGKYMLFCSETCKRLYYASKPSMWIENRGYYHYKPIGEIKSSLNQMAWKIGLFTSVVNIAELLAHQQTQARVLKKNGTKEAGKTKK